MRKWLAVRLRNTARRLDPVTFSIIAADPGAWKAFDKLGAAARLRGGGKC